MSQHLGVDRALITLCAEEFLFQTAQEVPSIALGERPRSRIGFSRLRFVPGPQTHELLRRGGAGGPRSPGDPRAFLCPSTGDGCVARALPDTCSCWCVLGLQGSFSLPLSLPPRPPASAQLEVLHYRLSVCSALHSPAHPSLQALHAHQVLAARVLSAPPAPWHKPRSSRLCSSEAWGLLG